METAGQTDSWTGPRSKSVLFHFWEGIDLVASQGFEPQYAESESAVLPLNDEAIIAGTAHDVKQPGRG